MKREAERELFTGATVRVSELVAYLDRDRLMDKPELAEWLGWSERKITGMLSQIPHYRMGRELRFRKVEVLEWLEQFRETGTTVDLEAIGAQVRARQKWAVKRHEGLKL